MNLAFGQLEADRVHHDAIAIGMAQRLDLEARGYGRLGKSMGHGEAMARLLDKRFSAVRRRQAGVKAGTGRRCGSVLGLLLELVPGLV
jgi:hypothetical protein